MNADADPQSGDDGAPKEEESAALDACRALLQKLAEPLTALTNYVEAARRLHRSEGAPRAELGAALDKADAQISRMHDLLRQMRDVLSPE